MGCLLGSLPCPLPLPLPGCVPPVLRSPSSLDVDESEVSPLSPAAELEADEFEPAAFDFSRESSSSELAIGSGASFSVRCLSGVIDVLSIFLEGSPPEPGLITAANTITAARIATTFAVRRPFQFRSPPGSGPPKSLSKPAKAPAEYLVRSSVPLSGGRTAGISSVFCVSLELVSVGGMDSLDVASVGLVWPESPRSNSPCFQPCPPCFASFVCHDFFLIIQIIYV